MNAAVAGSILSLLLFGGLGHLLARRLSRPLGPALLVMTLVGLLLAALGSRFVGTQIILIGVDDFTVRVNWSLVGLFVGGMVGLVLRNRQLRRLATAVA